MRFEGVFVGQYLVDCCFSDVSKIQFTSRLFFEESAKLQTDYRVVREEKARVLAVGDCCVEEIVEFLVVFGVELGRFPLEE